MNFSFVREVIVQRNPEFTLAANDRKAGCERSILITWPTAGLGRASPALKTTSQTLG